jgi:acyl-coenzyme A synthetase/AMP-(fatty) acid ligase
MPSLSEAIGAASRPTGRHLLGRDRRLSPVDLQTHTMLDAPPGRLAGRSVMLWTREQVNAAAAMIELDGRARRLLVCPPDIAEAHIPALMRLAEVDAVVTDRPPSECAPLGTTRTIRCLASPRPTASDGAATIATEWVLATSGTTGAPKLVVHSLEALTGAIRTQPPPADGTVWATFYDIRRYGGLQIFLRAILGGTSLVLSDEHESPSDHISRLAAAGATHITGTPSHWRRALMSPDVACLSPRYVRLSGEIADQPTLDMLRAAFPTARIGHAYASTEAGVAFDVEDGRAGFPESLLGNRGGVEMKVEDGTLRIRSDRTASRYLGPDAPALHDAEGFVDTGDFVTLVEGRYGFVGRQGGIINVGGQKVHPEEIEAVINAHPAVRMSLARAQRNPLTGSIVVADVVPAAAVPEAARQGLTDDIAEHCRSRLARHKVPVIIRFVPSLPITAGGKLRRTHA